MLVVCCFVWWVLSYTECFVVLVWFGLVGWVFGLGGLWFDFELWLLWLGLFHFGVCFLFRFVGLFVLVWYGIGLLLASRLVFWVWLWFSSLDILGIWYFEFCVCVGFVFLIGYGCLFVVWCVFGNLMFGVFVLVRVNFPGFPGLGGWLYFCLFWPEICYFCCFGGLVLGDLRWFGLLGALGFWLASVRLSCVFRFRVGFPWRWGLVLYLDFACLCLELTISGTSGGVVGFGILVF